MMTGPDTGVPFVIAEAGVNHNGDPALAHALIDAAGAAGANAVKFQTFTAERLAVPKAPKAAYQQTTTDPDESQVAMLKRLELPRDAYAELVNHARTTGLEFLSTPFDEEAADFLATLGVSQLKISSGDLTNTPLLAHAARFGLPLIVSTGMADLEEVAAAVAAIEATGNRDLTLLHCVTDYPAAPADANLGAMRTMADAFGYPVGYSDHTDGMEVALAAAALGAQVIEKHLTLDRNMPGPDHRASLEPSDFAAMVRSIRVVVMAIGDGRKVPAPSELANRDVVRKSVVAAADIPGGTCITGEMLAVRRPGTGLPPGERDRLIGRYAAKAIAAGTPIRAEMLAP